MEEIDPTSFRVGQGNGATKRQIDGTGRAILGATAVICGTFAAIVFMPDDPRPSGALFWSAVWCSVGLLTVPLLGLRKNIQTILYAENVLMIGLVYWLLLDLLQGAYSLDDVSYDDIALAFTSIGAMAVGIWIGMAGGGWSLPQLVLGVAERRLSGIALFRAIWITFFLGMFYFAYSSDFNPSLMIEALGWCRFCAPWATSESGGWNAFLVHLQYFGYVLPSLTVLLAQREGWLRPKTFVGMILSIIMIAFLSQQGGRRIIGVVVGAALVTWLILQKRLKPKVLVGGVIGITLLLVSMEIMLENRSLGFSSAYPTSGSESRLHVDDNFLRLSEIIHFIPEGQPYVGFQPLYYVSTLPIPRAIWPGKPTGPGYNLTELLGQRAVTLSHTIIGELYAMNGLIVVFIGGLVFGSIANMWNKILAMQGPDKSIVYSIGLLVLFAGLRSMQDLVIMSYGLFGWIVIARLLPGVRSDVAPQT